MELESSVVLSAADFVLSRIDLQKAMRVGEERRKNNLVQTQIICVCYCARMYLPQFCQNLFSPKREEMGEISTIFLEFSPVF